MIPRCSRTAVERAAKGMMGVYYNENDPYAAQWLCNLISAGLLPAGIVDCRDIRDVRSTDVKDFKQCHFFAGIGGWPLALRLAGWPETRPVWTGSCPCQPFSIAGRRKGTSDKRHLWPDWFRLIGECRPSAIFGEQVASPDALKWFDAVSIDLERSGYAIGAADLCAAGLGAPHIRQRLWFVAEPVMQQRNGGRLEEARWGQSSDCGGMGVPDSAGSQPGHEASSNHRHGGAPQSTSWTNCEWLPCTDGKSRPTKPGLFPLAHGIPSRVGRLRAYGNAVVPQVAAEMIKAYMARHT